MRTTLFMEAIPRQQVSYHSAEWVATPLFKDFIIICILFCIKAFLLVTKYGPEEAVKQIELQNDGSSSSSK